MILTKINYHENKDKDDFWEIKDVNLAQLNLIIGLNATGKSRLMKVINGLHIILSKKVKLNSGNWFVEIKDPITDVSYEYKLEINDNIIALEEITKNGKTILKRENESGEIYSDTQGKMVKFSPPKDGLTINVRRDVKEHPFLEDLLKWSGNFYGFSFSGVEPSRIKIPYSPETLLEGLESVPFLLEKILENNAIESSIIEAFTTIGYPIDNISIGKRKVPGSLMEFPVSLIKEIGLSCVTEQANMSQGMYRALSLVVIIQYLISLDKECTIVIDDLGEGLDFERSSKITKWLFETLRNSKIQLIATSNDRFLINSVDLECINILERNGHVVESFNYYNNKERFDEFKFMGLNNFDMLSGIMYKDWTDN
ncbi:hypothetical protein ASN18_1863 [Candidatus Magnetominusculus xianensis]|uniref:ATPase AAA-type core domain-containing protein n=2 Tax=Candidatus Magnetominusculus xianensis TaxID=1748249 RepID=A0ABR5SEK3_9BACT|nr:hypothetical protein ASN18_1863 [Candidatus Magnetominusculus xianensis]